MSTRDGWLVVATPGQWTGYDAALDEGWVLDTEQLGFAASVDGLHVPSRLPYQDRIEVWGAAPFTVVDLSTREIHRLPDEVVPDLYLGRSNQRHIPGITFRGDTYSATYVIDLETVTATPTGTVVRYGTPIVSDSGEVLVTTPNDGRSPIVELWISHPKTPTDPWVRYHAPPGTTFSGLGDVAADGRVTFTLIDEFGESRTYRGAPGESLNAISVVDALTFWFSDAPIEQASDGGFEMSVDGGLIAGISYIGCREGQLRSSYSPDGLQLHRPDYTGVAATVDAPESLEVGVPPPFSTRRFDVLYSGVVFNAPLGVLDCDTGDLSVIGDDAASNREAGFSVRLGDSRAGHLLFIVATPTEDRLIAIAEEFRALPMARRIRSVAVSPTGAYYALITEDVNGFELLTLEAATLDLVAQQRLDADAAAATWALG